MRYIKRFNEEVDKKHIEEICIEYNIKNYTINDDGTVDVKGNVELFKKGLSEIPVKFGIVTGIFTCSNNFLTSLEGSPKEVGTFICEHNKLTSLEGGPNKVDINFNCSHNQLISLKGAPEYVGSSFYCYANQLTSLEGGPKRVGNDYNCSHNQLVSLKGCPDELGNLYCSTNQLTSLEHMPSCLNIYCSNNPIYRWWEPKYIRNRELYLYMDINSNDPDEINKQKIDYLNTEIR